jgi:DNA-binding NarL/FixJ family response regulator
VKNTIRALICGHSDHTEQLVRGSLSRMPSVQTVGQASTHLDALDMSLRLRPSLIILSLPIPDLEGPEAGRLLLANAPEARLLAISDRWTQPDVHDMLSAGAAGCLHTDGDPEELSRAIQTVMFGGQYRSPRLLHIEHPPRLAGLAASKNQELL